ncbi:MAG TPA: alkaline phosphatase family protein [Acidimicrobiia bacterium]|nr:alkaline phosphatase family protein [Acidimicrobiia bacterium]
MPGPFSRDTKVAAPPSSAGAAQGPDYAGTGLLNLVAEIEVRLTGTSRTQSLASNLGSTIPEASSIVLILFDGLGDLQLNHPRAEILRHARVGTLEAPFPTTTTVSMSTIVTGTGPSTHGVIAHLAWIPELGKVVNTLKWVDLSGAAVDYPTGRLLPAPNLWERMTAAGNRVVTVQPAGFATTPLTAALYRGAEFVGAGSPEEFVDKTVQNAAAKGTLVFTYVPPVDFAAHVFGLASPEYSEAMTTAAGIWSGIADRLPAHAVMIGTADHGVPAIAETGKILVRNKLYTPLDFWGDPRAVMVRGSQRLIRRLAAETGAELVEPERFVPWLGPGPRHQDLDRRLPDALLLAPRGKVILPPGFDKRLVGYHGGLSREEVAIPLLIAR